MALGSVDSGNILPAVGNEDTLVASSDHLVDHISCFLAIRPCKLIYRLAHMLLGTLDLALPFRR